MLIQHEVTLAQEAALREQAAADAAAAAAAAAAVAATASTRTPAPIFAATVTPSVMSTGSQLQQPETSSYDSSPYGSSPNITPLNSANNIAAFAQCLSDNAHGDADANADVDRVDEEIKEAENYRAGEEDTDAMDNDAIYAVPLQLPLLLPLPPAFDRIQEEQQQHLEQQQEQQEQSRDSQGRGSLMTISEESSAAALAQSALSPDQS